MTDTQPTNDTGATTAEAYLAAVKKLAAGATYGPWRVRDLSEPDERGFYWVESGDPAVVQTITEMDNEQRGTEVIWGLQDAAFIASSRTVVPAMAEALENVLAVLAAHSGGDVPAEEVEQAIAPALTEVPMPAIRQPVRG